MKEKLYSIRGSILRKEKEWQISQQNVFVAAMSE